MRPSLVQAYPLALPLAAYAVGLKTGLEWTPAPLWAGAAALGAVLCLLASRRWPVGRFLAWALGAFALAWVRIAAVLPPLPDPALPLGAFSEARWRVESYAQCREDGCRFSARLLGYRTEAGFVPRELGVQLKTREERFVIPGEVYRSPLRLRPPRTFRNPHSFDYPRYLRLQGITATAYLEAPDAIQRERPAPWPYRWVGEIRRELRAVLQASVPEPRARGVLAALLLGEGGMLTAETEEDFRRAGLTHVLVVSGLHFTFVLVFFQVPAYALLSLRRRWSDSGAARRAALGLGLVPVLGYGFLVGLSPSVLRALGACALLFVAATARLRRNFFSTLILVAAVLLLWRPLWLFSLSFQLSFLSVAAACLFGAPWAAWLQEKASAPWRWGLTLLYTTCAVQLALLPLLAASFHEVSVVAPVANLLFVPFFAALLLPAELFGSLLFFLRPAWGGLCFAGLGRLTAWVLPLLEALARGRGSSVLVGPWRPLEFAAYLLALAALWKVGDWKKFFRRSGLALILFLLNAGMVRMEKTPPLLRLDMLDVGQGESLLLRLPEGPGLVLDGGGFPASDFDVGRNVVLPELLAAGIPRPRALILSHPDADHWKGLRYLAERLEPEEFWVGEGTLEHPDFAVLRATVEKNGIPLRVLRQGERWKLGGADFEVLWPPPEAASRGLSDNNLSLVLRVCYRNTCFLLTGDLEAEGEAAIADRLGSAPESLLKVAHHGSATSSDAGFLRRLAPRWALISAGRDNRYRFPNAGVLRRLEAVGAKVARTDSSGMISAESDGEKIAVRPFIAWPAPSWWRAIRAVVSGSRS